MSTELRGASEATHIHVGGACVTVCRERMVERSREPERVRWCFKCRKRLMHDLVVLVPDGLSYYGPMAGIECHGCGGDHADFPGSYRDGPRYGFEDF